MCAWCSTATWARAQPVRATRAPSERRPVDALSLFPVFLVGLAGSVHCVGMCGGIVSAFSMAPAGAPAFPVAVITQAAPRAAEGALRVIAYNTGRIGSYALAGAIA